MDFVSRTPKQSAWRIPKLADETLKPRKSIPKIGERLPKPAGDVLKPPRTLYKMPKLYGENTRKTIQNPMEKSGTTHNSCPSSKLLERQAIRRPARRPAISWWGVLEGKNHQKCCTTLEKNMHFLVEHVNYSGIFNSLLDGIDVVWLDMFGMFVVFWGWQTMKTLGVLTTNGKVVVFGILDGTCTVEVALLTIKIKRTSMSGIKYCMILL